MRRWRNILGEQSTHSGIALAVIVMLLTVQTIIMAQHWGIDLPGVLHQAMDTMNLLPVVLLGAGGLVSSLVKIFRSDEKAAVAVEAAPGTAVTDVQVTTQPVEPPQ